MLLSLVGDIVAVEFCGPGVEIDGRRQDVLQRSHVIIIKIPLTGDAQVFIFRPCRIGMKINRYVPREQRER
jgi:hypothetical protein